MLSTAAGLHWLCAGEPATDSVANQLTPYVVNAPRFEPVMTPREQQQAAAQRRLQAFLDFGYPGWGSASTPERAVQDLHDLVFPLVVLDPGAVPDSSHPAEVGPAVGSASWFAPYGGGSSMFPLLRAQPRAALLLDGIPIRDPWNGTPRWDSIPADTLDRIELAPGGAAAAWDDSGSGVIQFFEPQNIGKWTVRNSTPPSADRHYTFPPKRIVAADGDLSIKIGSFATRAIELVHSQPMRDGVLQLLGRSYDSAGDYTLPATYRGAVDRPADSHSRLFQVRWNQVIGSQLQLGTSILHSTYNQGLGTPDQRENSSDLLASMTLVEQPDHEREFSERLYFQDTRRRRTFAFANSTRSEESPALQIVGEPVSVIGASFSAEFRRSDPTRTNFGLDLRFVHGEQRSLIDPIAGIFTTERNAGADTATAGFFVIHHQRLTSDLKATVGIRFDENQVQAGHINTLSRSDVSAASSEPIPSTCATEVSPSIGIVCQPAVGWHLRAGVQQGFVRPTLGERFGLDGTETAILQPNHKLHDERDTTAQLSADYVSNAGTFAGTLSVFANRLRDAIGTREVQGGMPSTPSTSPTGYQERVSLNLDEARLYGIHASAAWNPSPAVTLAAEYIVADSRIQRVAAAPGLAGKRLPQSPEQSGLFTLRWTPRQRIQFWTRLRIVGRRYADEENNLLLKSACICSAGLVFSINHDAELFLSIENLNNARLADERSLSGLVYSSLPRNVGLGIRLRW